MKRFHYLKGSKQNGVATLLILILVGISIAAAVFGSLRYIQGSQNQTTALHAQTQAQITAWAGVEVIYQYLKNISSSDMETLITAAESATSKAPVEVDFDGELRAGFYKNGDDLYALVKGTTAADTRAQSTSTVEVVYHGIALNPNKTEGGGGDCAPFCLDAPPSIITFNRDLRLGGNIVVTKKQGESYQINVKGVVTTGGNSITGVDNINATDSIKIGSGSTYKNLHSNGDIHLSGSVRATEDVLAQGNICVEGGAWPGYPGVMRANGFIYTNMSGHFGRLEARSMSTYTGDNPQCEEFSSPPLNAKDEYGVFGVRVINSTTVDGIISMTSVHNPGGTVTNLEAYGNLYTGHGKVILGKILADDAQYCSSSNNGKPTGCQPASDSWNAGGINIVGKPEKIVDPVDPVEVTVTTFDAYKHLDDVNYAFKYNNEKKKIEVTVRNVEGIGDEEEKEKEVYTFRPYTENSEFPDYLCKEKEDGSCEETHTICMNGNNSCIKYENGTWMIGHNGNPQIVPGVLWFDGDVDIKNGVYYNTFISTRNIIVNKGTVKVYAPNYAGYSGSVNNVEYAPKGVCVNTAFSYKPINLCEAFIASALDNYDPNLLVPIANYAFMAGSFVNDDYKGGNITLGAGQVVYGSVLAGHEYLSNTGNVTIHGYITALATGQKSVNHEMGASLNVILNKLPPTYIPMSGISTGSEPSENNDNGSDTDNLVCNSPVCLAGDAYIAKKFSARYW